VRIEFKKLNPDARIPEYKTAGAAGADVYAVKNADIRPGGTTLIELGFSIAIPEGYEVQVRSRSGLALKNQVIVLNSPGTIDSDYRGPMGVILANFGKDVFYVNKGDRVAQLVINKVETFPYEEVEELDETERGVGGFGSTGVSS